MAEGKSFTLSEVSEHNRPEDLYIIINDKVYDCTSFIQKHPGGEEVILNEAGQDATASFEDVGHSEEARKILDEFYIGNAQKLPGDSDSASQSDSTALDSGSDSKTWLYLLAFFTLIIALIFYDLLW